MHIYFLQEINVASNASQKNSVFSSSILKCTLGLYFLEFAAHFKPPGRRLENVFINVANLRKKYAENWDG